MTRQGFFIVITISLTLLFSISVVFLMNHFSLTDSYYITVHPNHKQKDFVSIKINESFQLDACSYMEKETIDLSLKGLHWASDDPDIVFVDEKKGVAVGKKSGTTEINLCNDTGYCYSNSGSPISITVYVGDLLLSSYYTISPEKGTFQSFFNHYAKDNYIVLKSGDTVSLKIKSSPCPTMINQTEWHYYIESYDYNYDVAIVDGQAITGLNPGCVYLYAKNKNIIPPLNYIEDTTIYAEASLTIFVTGKELLKEAHIQNLGF